MKKYILVIFALSALMLFGCSGDNEYLNTQYVDADPTQKDQEPIPIHPMFDNGVGTWQSLFSFAGAIDPVGTILSEDFDGDGINNDDETTTNIWVADYPVIETHIAAPVTLRIEIQDSATGSSKQLSTEITASNVENTSDKSTEAVHRNEVNLKTVQFQDQFSRSNSMSQSQSRSMSVSASGTAYGCTAKASMSQSSSVSRSFSNAYGETKTKWKDVPFKNNTNRNGWALNRKEAAKNSRKLRGEMKRAFNGTNEVKSNAGYVRASLYINNMSVNMPVKLRDITCSLMLETPEGELLPVQSFKLRNNDYSMFEIELYGNSTFGPYVVELDNLNTHEIKEAIKRGYNPKIFIIDYEMRHVESSNYRDALAANYTGDNLKIIEENAKGRTAGVRFVGPGIREFYRVVAFDTNANDSDENASSAGNPTAITPGVPLKKALKRVSFSKNQKGDSIEYANYVLDFTGIDPLTEIENPSDPNNPYPPRVLVRGIKSVNGVETKLPLADVILDDENFEGEPIYVMKKLSEWDEKDFEEFKIWVIFDKGKYYANADDSLDGSNNMQEFTYSYTDSPTVPVTVPVVKGLNSVVWPGDHYDIVYLDMAQHLGLEYDFGTNPIETVVQEAKIIRFNTRWNAQDVGKHPFYPDTMSKYLGTAAPGDIIEVKIKLKDTHYLNPNFGTPEVDDDTSIFSKFDYNWSVTNEKFDIDEALDFEISFGLGGDHSDWVNLLDVANRSPYAEYHDKFTIVDRSWDFLDQEYTLYIRLADEFDGVEQDGEVNLFMRPALNNAYRESIWPLRFMDVKKFRGVLAGKMQKDVYTISVMYGTGEIAVEDNEIYIGGVENKIVSVTPDKDDNTRYTITLLNKLAKDHERGEQVYVDLEEENEPGCQDLRLAVNNSFANDWNAEHGTEPPALPDDDGYMPLLSALADTTPARYLGFDTALIIANWLGNNNYNHPHWNNWVEGTKLEGFLDRLFNPLLKTSAGTGMRLFAHTVEGELWDDFIASVDNEDDQISPQIAIDGDRVLMVWVSKVNELRGRVFDFSKELPEPVGEEFEINTTSSIINDPRIAISEGRAFVVWSINNTSIMGRIYDIAGETVVPVTNELTIDTNGGGLQYTPDVAITGNRAIVAWIDQTAVPLWAWSTECRIYDISGPTPAPLDSVSMRIHYNHTSSATRARVVAYDGKAFIVWKNSDDIRGAIYDISGTTPVAYTEFADFLVSKTNNGIQGNQVISMAGSRALVAWESNDSGTNDIRGRLFDLSGENPDSVNGMDDVLISTNNVGEQINPHFSMAENHAFITWQSNDNGTDYDIRGIIWDISGDEPGPLREMDDFLISTSNSEDQITPFTSFEGNRVFITWSSMDNGSNNDIRGMVYDVSGSELLPINGVNDFLVSTTNHEEQQVPQVVSNGGSNFVAWQSSDFGGNFNIRARNLIFSSDTGLSLPHGLNYFMVSPLIERNFDVEVNIVE